MNFRTWLQSMSGGRRSAKEAKKNSSHVSSILKHIGLSDVKQIGQLQSLKDIDKKFIEPKRQNAQASTVKNHLLSLQKLGEYMLLQELDFFGKEQYDRLSKQVSLWNRSLGTDIRERNAEKGAKDNSK